MSRRQSTRGPVLGYEGGIPLVAARVVPGRPYLLLVIHCPFCGREHTHGAGLPHEDPREYAGHRLVHCVARTPETGRGYILVVHDDDSVAPKKAC